MKYFFPLHFDGDNRGCEGIAKGTASIIGASKNDLIGYSRNVELDSRLGISDYISLIPQHPVTVIDKIQKKIEGILNPEFSRTDLYFKYQYRKFLKQITTNDIMISTGGDMMCYGNNMVNVTNNFLHERGVRTVLWGCSMGEQNYTPEKHETLRNFSLIYARESLSYNFFKNLGLKNVVCLPDPAFVLEPQVTALPSFFGDNEVIGINISPYILKGNNMCSTFGKELKSLLDFIFNETKLYVLLIPHVLWHGQDDRETASVIENMYRKTNRISILDSTNLNYQQIRFIISKCKFFIGGRTHAVISAYSTCIPTIALGYSIKSKGIAKDLELNEKLIVNANAQNSKLNLLNSFTYLMDDYQNIKDTLFSIMPTYKLSTFLIKDYISKL